MNNPSVLREPKVEAVPTNASVLVQLAATLEMQRVAIDDIKRALVDTRQELHEVLSRLERDMLTGAYNRHGMNAALAREISRASRSAMPLSVVMVDVDGFKAVNDTHGHQVGDELLRQIAAHIRHVLRESDTLVRFGGDEFLLILPDTDATDAAYLVERLGQTARPLISNSKAICYTLSTGVAQFEDGESAHSLVGRADQRLYHAKRLRHGRRQIENDDASRLAYIDSQIRTVR